MLGNQVQTVVILQIELYEELLIFILNEMLGVWLPGTQVYFWEELVRDELEDLSSTILSITLHFWVTVRDGLIHHLHVELSGLFNLRFEVLEFDWGDDHAYSIVMPSDVFLRVVNVGLHHSERGNQSQFAYPLVVDLTAVEDGCQNTQVFIERVVHEEVVAFLQVTQFFKEAFYLGD